MENAYEMIMAAKEGQVDVVKVLAQEDPRLADCKDSVGQTPLMWASYKGHQAVAAVLIEIGAQVDECNCQSGRTALYMACEFGNWGVAELLLKHGANPAFRRKLYGRDCLMIAAFNGHANVVKGLLECGFGDVDATDNNRCTAIRLAVRADRLAATVRVLLDHGADPLKKDKEGKTALSFARDMNNEECIRVLEDWERLYMCSKGRWIIREGHLYEDLMENSKCNISVKEVPRYIRKRVWEKQHSSSAPTAAQQATGGGKNNNSPRTGALPTIEITREDDVCITQAPKRTAVERNATEYIIRDMPYGVFLQFKELF